MDALIKEKLLRLTIMTLEFGDGHLRTLQFEGLADEVFTIIDKCYVELTGMIPDREPGLLRLGELDPPGDQVSDSHSRHPRPVPSKAEGSPPASR